MDQWNFIRMLSKKKKKKSGQISFHYLKKKKKGKVTEAISSDNA